MSNNVIPLKERRLKRELEKGLSMFDPQGLLNIPFEDITQGVDTANESPSDPILLGPKATAAIKRLYAEFGITSMPATIGELLGSFWYCKTLQSFAIGSPAGVSEQGKKLEHEATLSTFEEYAPELLESVIAARAKDKDALKEIHEKWLPLSRMARHYDPEKGWACGRTGPLRESPGEC